MSTMEIVLFAFSGVLMAVALISVLVGKTPYLGFFQRNFIARRKWNPEHFWGGVAQYVVVSAVLGLCGFLAH